LAGLDLKDEQRRKIKKLRGFDQYLTLYDQVCLEKEKWIFFPNKKCAV
jgi:uncharacterized membrane protein